MDAITAALEVDWSSPPAWVTIPGILVGFCIFVFLSNEWHFSSFRMRHGARMGDRNLKVYNATCYVNNKQLGQAETITHRRLSAYGGAHKMLVMKGQDAGYKLSGTIKAESTGPGTTRYSATCSKNGRHGVFTLQIEELRD